MNEQTPPQQVQNQQPKIEIKISQEELSKRKLFLGCPQYGGMCGGLFSRSMCDLAALCAHHKIQLQLHYLFNESLITRARNYICDEFVRSGADHLMFIDSDIGFDARDVIALMALQTQDEKFDIIGGPYPKKCISWEKIIQAVDKGIGRENAGDLDKFVGDYVFNPKDGQNQIPIFQPVEVREIGTGFMMIRKSVFEKFTAAFPQYSYRPDHVRTQHFDGSREIMQYFQAEIDGVDFTSEYKKIIDKIMKDPKDPELVKKTQKRLDALKEEAQKKSKRYLSEDYWFSQRCQEIGVRTFLCPWMKLSHQGTFVFGGSLIDLASIGSAATADVSLLKKK